MSPITISEELFKLLTQLNLLFNEEISYLNGMHGNRDRVQITEERMSG